MTGEKTIRFFHLRNTNYSDEVITSRVADYTVTGDEQMVPRLRALVPSTTVLMYRHISRTRPVDRLIKDYDYTLQWAARDVDNNLMYDQDNPPSKGNPYTIMDCTKFEWRKHFAEQSEQVRQQWGFDGFFLDNAYSYPYPNRWVIEVNGEVRKAVPPQYLLDGYRAGIRDMVRRLRLLTFAPIITNISKFEWSLNQCRYVTALLSETYIVNEPDKTQWGTVYLCI